MKNKKKKYGFTLIELLATIVILSIISAIAVPIILGVVEEARKESFARSAELVASATNINVNSKQYDEKFVYTIVDGIISEGVQANNTTGMNGIIEYDEKGRVSYAIHNYKYCVTKSKELEKTEINDYDGECTIPSDEIPPTIVLTTPNSYLDSARIKITVTDTGGSGLSEENMYKYYLSTSESELKNGDWYDYQNDVYFEISGDGEYYLWVYPVKDNLQNVSENKTFGEPYAIKKFTFTYLPKYTFIDKDGKEADSTLIDDENGNWRIKFLEDGFFTTETDILADVFLVGGGGGSGSGSAWFGGGGGGYTKTVTNYIQAGIIHEIIVGEGGDGTDGESTLAFGNEAGGGKVGKSERGGDGGSGGGNGSWSYGWGGSGGSYGNHGGSGSGPYAAGQGQGYTTCEFGEGTLSGCNQGVTAYSGGGGGVCGDYDDGGPGGGGAGGGGRGGHGYGSAVSGTPNTGGGGGGANGYARSGKGGSGIVIIRNARNVIDINISYTYTGESTIISDGDGNWRIRFLTSGTLIPKEDIKIDAFLVGGGGSGGSGMWTGGGGGGYTKTIEKYSLEKDKEYEIIIGNGGVGTDGEATLAFNEKADGGKVGTTEKGGAGGSGGGNGSWSYAQGGYGGSYGNKGGSGSGPYEAGEGQGSTTCEFGEGTLEGCNSGVAIYSGGGGGVCGEDGTPGKGGGGGGGKGGLNSDKARDGIPNTGGGGGGAATLDTAGKGGSGIVVIRNAR